MVPRGDADSSSWKRGKWYQLHCRAELAAATGEVTLKVWKLGLRSLRGGNKNHGAPARPGLGAARWEEQGSLVGLYRASSEGRGGNKILLETGSGHKHLWVCGCPFPGSGSKLELVLHQLSGVLGGVMHMKMSIERK